MFSEMFSEWGGEHFDSEKEIENTATKMAKTILIQKKSLI
jgi:hypothetical protein